jgi:nucleotide-binding universal stress UspA family protein
VEVLAVEVVVGVSGGDRSDAAVIWGARESVRLGTPLTLVHAYTVPAVPSVGGPLRTPEMRHEAETSADKLLQRAQRIAELAAPGVESRTESLRGPAEDVLPVRSKGARALVVGGHESHLGHRLGATVAACLRHAPCTVVVVPQGTGVTGYATAGSS